MEPADKALLSEILAHPSEAPLLGDAPDSIALRAFLFESLALHPSLLPRILTFLDRHDRAFADRTLFAFLDMHAAVMTLDDQVFNTLMARYEREPEREPGLEPDSGPIPPSDPSAVLKDAGSMVRAMLDRARAEGRPVDALEMARAAYVTRWASRPGAPKATGSRRRKP
jgi:hypothetical protein